MTDKQEIIVQETDAAGRMIAVIERAIMSPDMSVDTLERVLAMQERIMAKDAEMAYTVALADAQQEIKPIEKRGAIKNRSGEVQSTFGKWEDINEVIKPILQTHGLALSFRTGSDDKGRLTVTAVLTHRAGHREETTISLPADTSGSKNDVQAVGSSTSYGKRYTAGALLNLTFVDEDDDGQKANGTPISAEAKEDIIDLIQKTGTDTRKALEHFYGPDGPTSLDELTTRAPYPYGLLTNGLRDKLKKMGAKNADA